MLAASAAYAELRSRNRLAVGASALQRGAEIGQLVRAYEHQVHRITNVQFELDVPDSYLESAWIGDWESAYDIAISQVSTYCYSLMQYQNPAWTAVTGYYAAFFAVRALLFGTGIGHRSLPRTANMPGGLYELTTRQSSSSVGVSTLVLTSQGGGGSHKAAWARLDSTLASLLVVGGLDVGAAHTIDSARKLIGFPRHVSAFRNAVNYSLDIAAVPIQPWSSDLRRVVDEQALEEVIDAAMNARDEVRIELLLLAALSWIRLLYVDYLDRAVRPDRRRSRARTARVSSDVFEIAEIVQRWL